MLTSLFGALLLASSPAAPHAYGDTLLAAQLRREPHLLAAAIDMKGEKPLHFEAGNDPAAAGALQVELKDALGDPAGTLTLRFDRKVSPAAARRRADAVALYLSRRFYAPSVLAEADPFVAGAERSKLGQALVERQLERRPRLVTIAFHVALAGKPNAIIASNFGRIGKPADGDDNDVIDHKAIHQELTNAGRRLAVELPLLDRSGRLIGALSTSFLLGPEGRDAAYRAALAVQRDLAPAIPSLEALEKSEGR